MKTFALDGRDKAKDAYDIYFCVRNFPGGPTAPAETCKPLLEEEVVRDGYSRIAAKFRSHEDFGPHTVSRFLGETGWLDNMNADPVRVDAHRQVRARLDALGFALPTTSVE